MFPLWPLCKNIFRLLRRMLYFKLMLYCFQIPSNRNMAICKTLFIHVMTEIPLSFPQVEASFSLHFGGDNSYGNDNQRCKIFCWSLQRYLLLVLFYVFFSEGILIVKSCLLSRQEVFFLCGVGGWVWLRRVVTCFCLQCSAGLSIKCDENVPRKRSFLCNVCLSCIL